jgi:aarF domain-containing kinase
VTLFTAATGAAAYFGKDFFLVSVLPPPPPVFIEQPNNDELIRSVRKWRVCVRLVQLVFWFLPLVLLIPLVMIIPGLRLWYIRCIKRTLETVGPAFVKLGQWAVTREDLVPHDVCEILGELHQHVRPHSSRYSKKLIEKELGIKFDDVFVEFDPVPLGSGSIAQVHKARLRSTGELVAIKVCHPRVKERIALDFMCLKWLAKIFDPLVPRADLQAIADQFATSLSLQVDLRYEAKNLQRFCENFKHLPQVTFPQPYMELTSEKVMVETFMDAVPIKELTEASRGLTQQDLIPIRNIKMVELGLDLYLQMIIRDNFFHADMHPGNILFKFGPDGVTPYVAMVDAGITQTLTPEERSNVFKFMQGVQTKDGLAVGKCILNFSTKGQPYCNQEAFLKDMQALFSELMPHHPEPKWRKWGKKLGLIKYKLQRSGQVSAIVGRMFEVTRNHNVIMDSTYVSLLFSSLMVEGICNAIDPSVDVLRFSQRWFIASPLQRILGLSKHQAKSTY